MENKDFIKIINEEISNFDFLGNDQYLKEQESVDLLRNEDFQKQFICDSLLSINDNRKTERNNKIKIRVVDSRVGGNWEEDYEDATYITLEYYLEVSYLYDRNSEPMNFTLNFDSEKIDVVKSGYYNAGNYETAPEGEAYFSHFNWNNITVTIFTMDGDEIEFTAFKRAPRNIQVLFIKEYTESYIVNNTLDIRQTDKEFTNLSKSSYC